MVSESEALEGDAEETKASFVLTLPPDLPARDAVTLASARGLELSEREVATIRSAARLGQASNGRPRGALGTASSWLTTSVRWHLKVFVTINVFLAALNLAVSPGFLWFLWVAGTWGLGLAFHIMGAQGLAEATRERERLRPSRSGRHRAGETRDQGGRRRRRDRGAEGRTPAEDVQDDALEDEDALTHVEGAQSVSDAPTNWASEEPHAPAPAPAPTLTPGQRVAGRFVIDRMLGKGGMGEVYVARDEVLGEDVALKTISATLYGEDAVARFLREAQAARRITHPNVIRIHDIGRDGSLSFISMHYVVGQTLHRRIHEELQLEYDELARIASQLCAGLAAAHAVGVIHRDLKPDNVLLDDGGQVRIIDFGLAKLQSANTLTATGAIMGTPEYMAPEQLRGQATDARTDIYAVGCILYQAIAGVPPFRRDSAVAIGVAHCYEDPPPLAEYRPDLPAAWEALVLKALSKSADDRYQSADALREAIEAVAKADAAP